MSIEYIHLLFAIILFVYIVENISFKTDKTIVIDHGRPITNVFDRA